MRKRGSLAAALLLVAAPTSCTQDPAPPEVTADSEPDADSGVVLEVETPTGAVVRVAISGEQADRAGMSPSDFTLETRELGDDQAPSSPATPDLAGVVIELGPPGVDLGAGVEMEVDLPAEVVGGPAVFPFVAAWDESPGDRYWRALSARPLEDEQDGLVTLLTATGEYAVLGHHLADPEERASAELWNLLPRQSFVEYPSAETAGLLEVTREQPYLTTDLSFEVHEVDGDRVGSPVAASDVETSLGVFEVPLPAPGAPGYFELRHRYRGSGGPGAPVETLRRGFVVEGALDVEPGSELALLALEYAPVVEFAPDEDWFPVALDSSYFDADLELVRGPAGLVVSPPDTLDELVARGFSDVLMNGNGRPWASRVDDQGDPTLYVSAHSDDSPETLGDDGARVLLTWWMFYLHDAKDTDTCDGLFDASHDRDRESVTIEFVREHGAWEPRRVAFAGHLASQTLSPEGVDWVDPDCPDPEEPEGEWETGRLVLDWEPELEHVDRIGTHPVVYVARGSHAVYPRPGGYFIHTWGNATGEVAGGGERLCPPGVSGDCDQGTYWTSGDGGVRLLPRLEDLALDSSESQSLLFSGFWVDVPVISNVRFPPFIDRYYDAAGWLDTGATPSEDIAAWLVDTAASAGDDDDAIDDDDVLDDDDAVDDDDVVPDPECEADRSMSCGDSTTVEGNNGSGAADIDDWGCIGFPLTGPEVAYSFVSPLSGEVTLTLDGMQPGQDLDLLVVPEDSFGVCLPAGCMAASTNADQAPEVLDLWVTAGATYYLVVDGWDGSVSDFVLTLDCGASGDDDDDTLPDDDDTLPDDDDTLPDDDDATPEPCVDDSFEDNDSSATAASLGLGAHSGLRTCEGDEDWFAVTLTGPADLSIEATFIDAEGDVDLELMDASGGLLDISQSTADFELVEAPGAAAGTYLLNVYLFADYGSVEGNDYDLEVTAASSGSITTPSPADGGLVELPETTLYWVGPAGWTYDVYLGTGGSPTWLGSASSAEIDVTGLLFDTEYTWYVVGDDPAGGSVTGPEWTFTTPSTLPALPAGYDVAEVGTGVTVETGLTAWSNLSYSWSQIEGPAVTTTNPDPASIAFEMGPGREYTFALYVTGSAFAYTDTVSVRPYHSAGTRSGAPYAARYWAPQDLPLHYRINLGSHAGGPLESALISAIEDGLQEWADVPTSYVSFVYDGLTTAGVANDGVNVVYADETGAVVPGAGIMLPSYDSEGHYEDTDLAWNAIPGSVYLATPSTNLKALITHESGHMLGFAHALTGTDSAIAANTVQPSLSPHDVAMVSALYPSASFAAGTGSVSGWVEDLAGDPMFASVVLIDASQPQPRVYQGHSEPTTGAFVVNGVQPGSYQVLVESGPLLSGDSFINRYALGAATVTVSAGSDAAIGAVTVTPPPMETISAPGGTLTAIFPVASTETTYVLSRYWLYAYDHVTETWLGTPGLLNGSYLNGLDYSPDTQRLALLDQAGKSLHVVDTDPASPTWHQEVASVTGLPFQPVKLEYSDGGGRLDIACNGANSVAVVDTSSYVMTDEVPVGAYTQDVTVDEVGMKAYAGVYSGLLSPQYQLAEIELDPSSPSYHSVVRMIPLGTTSCWNQVTDGTSVYSVGPGIDEIDIASGTVGALPGTSNPDQGYTDLALSPSGQYLYYLDRDDPILRNSQLRIYDLFSQSFVETVLLSGDAYHQLALSEDGSRLAVSESGGQWMLFELAGGLPL